MRHLFHGAFEVDWCIKQESSKYISQHELRKCFEGKPQALRWRITVQSQGSSFKSEPPPPCFVGFHSYKVTGAGNGLFWVAATYGEVPFLRMNEEKINFLACVSGFPSIFVGMCVCLFVCLSVPRRVFGQWRRPCCSRFSLRLS